jgi:hypothetical protein
MTYNKKYFYWNYLNINNFNFHDCVICDFTTTYSNCKANSFYRRAFEVGPEGPKPVRLYI